MDTTEMIKELEEIKIKATKIGFAFMRTKLPIPIGSEFTKILAPFLKIEKGCKKAIQLIEKSK